MMLEKLKKSEMPIIGLFQLFKEGKSGTGAVANNLTEQHADDIIEAVNYHIEKHDPLDVKHGYDGHKLIKFWDDNHPEPGAVRSEVGVGVKDCNHHEWYYIAGIVNNIGEFMGHWEDIDRCVFLLPEAQYRVVMLHTDDTVYPIAKDDESKGEKPGTSGHDVSDLYGKGGVIEKEMERETSDDCKWGPLGWTGTNEQLCDELATVWDAIVLEDDDKLTVDAQELKQRLLAIVAKPKEPKPDECTQKELDYARAKGKVITFLEKDD